MVKYLLTGVAVSAATLLPAGLALWLAQAQAQRTGPTQCPQSPVWMEGFGFQELMPLNPQQYRAAQVNGNGVRVRDRAGFDSNVVFTLSRQDTVQIIGEAWDTGCNQWMRVRTDRGDYWMHGNVLVDIVGGPSSDPVSNLEAQPRVTAVCPKAIWMEPFRLFELNALAPAQYRPARANFDDVNVRDGVGMEATVAFTLPRNASVMVMGEAWDSDCNQWMQVRTDRGDYWMHGNTLVYNTDGLPPPQDIDDARDMGDGPPSVAFVIDQCPQAEWMAPFRLFELSALSPGQYRPARATADTVNVRDGAGFESGVAFTLPRDAAVTVMGEAWDGDCNQWMQVRTDRGDYWMHGNTLAYGNVAPTNLPRGSGPIDEPFVTEQCPKAVWTAGYRINELISLAPAQHHTAIANENNTYLRNKAGFKSDILMTLNAGEPMTIVGEAWDADCNQWMQVRHTNQEYWVYGNQVRK